MSEINVEDFPSNSHSSKENAVISKPPEIRQVKQVTHGKVTMKKPGVGKRLADTFLGDDINNIKDYLYFDVVVPSIKETIVDMVSNGIEMLFGVGNRRTRHSNQKPYTNYSSISYEKNPSVKKREKFSESRRRSYDGDDVYVDTRAEAEEIISNLDDLCRDYGMARVADLYDMVGVTPNFTAEKWGWESVAGARAIRQRGGQYYISLPRPIYLES